MYTTGIRLGFMINEGMSLSSSRRLIFGGAVIAVGLTGNSLFTVKLDLKKSTHRPSGSCVRNRNALMVSSGSILESAQFGRLNGCRGRCLHLLVGVVD